MALCKAALQKSVSTGFEKSEVVEASTVSLVDIISQLEEIAKIQQTQEQIWHWLKLIGERVGIGIGESMSATG